MILLQIIIFILSGFIGYVIGRWGDNYVNFWIKDPPWAPHHWIYGALLMMGALFLRGNLNIWVFSFGLGLFISDLQDFLDFKFFGSDNKTKEEVRFWHID